MSWNRTKAAALADAWPQICVGMPPPDAECEIMRGDRCGGEEKSAGVFPKKLILLDQYGLNCTFFVH